MGARQLRWGFKSEANRIAREMRLELGVCLADPLCPWALARMLRVPVLPLSALREAAPDAVRHFAVAEPRAFSALTVFDGPRRLVVHNDARARPRQASDVAHEIAHALLQHPPRAPLDERGCRVWDDAREAEADWLAAALLVSDEAALAVARRGLQLTPAAAAYGVSEDMMRFRLNVTGARRRAAA